MQLGLEKIDWELAGAKLAVENDETQAEFFRSFVKECLSWGTRYQAEFQLAGISQKLKREEKELLAMLSEGIK